MRHRLNQIDFTLIAGWALLFPAKDSKAYFLGFALLAAFFLTRVFLRERHLATSGFTLALSLVVLALFASVLAAPNRQNALLLLSDLILAGLVITCLDNRRSHRDNRFIVLMVLTSLTSLVTVTLRFAGVAAKPGFFFTNPILQGVISGLAAVLLIHALVRRFAFLFGLMLVVNLAGVFASASKAAFIGTVAFGLLSIPVRRWRWILVLVGIAAMTFVIPNPVRDMFHYSLKHDPYAANRIDIWAMSLRMGRAFFPWGTGLGSFGVAAPAFNFPQEEGPARFFKVPRRSHNDYLKLVVESGVPGLAVLLILGVGIMRRLFHGGMRHRSGPAVLFLVFQALLFNLLFQLAFLLIFLFLLDDWLESPRNYHSPTPAMRISLVAFLCLIALSSYVLPFLAGRHLEAARTENDFLRAFRLAHRAARLTPLAPEPQMLLAELYRRYDTLHPSLRALATSRRHIAQAQRLNPYSAKAPVFEATLLERLITRNMKYPGLEKEILTCLDRARDAAPLDPFVRMHRARIRFEFNHPAEAAGEARSALALEPRFLEARVFLQRHFPEKADPENFRCRVAGILAMRRRLHPQPGTYLFELFSLPPADRGWLRGTFPGLRLPAAPQ